MLPFFPTPPCSPRASSLGVLPTSSTANPLPHHLIKASCPGIKIRSPEAHVSLSIRFFPSYSLPISVITLPSYWSLVFTAVGTWHLRHHFDQHCQKSNLNRCTLEMHVKVSVVCQQRSASEQISATMQGKQIVSNADCAPQMLGMGTVWSGLFG